MFVKTAKRVIKGKEYLTHYLTVGYRDKTTGKVKHKHLSNISCLPPKQILALKESFKNNTEISKVRLENLEVLATKQYGSVKVFEKLFDKNFKSILSPKYYQEIKAIVINKIFEPKSKNALKNWLKKVDLNSQMVSRNKLYYCLDYLKEEQSHIEKKIIKNSRGLKLLLYDITSTYFEGVGAKNLCKLGYSRDKKKDKVQINIGLVTTAQGRPLSVEVFAGNICDKKTLHPRVKSLQERYNINKAYFVFDRGMRSEANLDNLIDSGYEYITALSHAQLRAKAEENKAIQLSLFDKQELADFIVERNGRKVKYVLCHNPVKQLQDKKNRIALIEKTEKRLEEIKNFKRKYSKDVIQDKVSKGINKYKMEKFIDYEINDGKLTYWRKEEKIKEKEQYDGFYMLESSDPILEKQEIQQYYKDLQFVERAFDNLKNIISLRPVNHYKAERIIGHTFSCFMSYLLLYQFKEKAKELLKKHSLDFLLTELECISISFVKIDNFALQKISKLNPVQKDLLKLFKVKLL